MAVVPDIPHEVDIQIQRSEFLAEKVVMRIPDDSLGEDVRDDDSRVGDGATDRFPIHSFSAATGFQVA
jgi:hypothetical protein